MSPRVAQRDETRTRILDSAVHLFEHEASGVMLKDIAARAEVAIPTVLFHFGSRVQLLMAVRDRLAVEVEAGWPAPGMVGDTLAALEAMLHPRLTTKVRALWRVGDEISWVTPRAPTPTVERLHHWLRAHLLYDGHGPDDAQTLADLITPGVLMVNRRVWVNRAPSALGEGYLDAVRQVLSRWDAVAAERPATRVAGSGGA